MLLVHFLEICQNLVTHSPRHRLPNLQKSINSNSAPYLILLELSFLLFFADLTR